MNKYFGVTIFTLMKSLDILKRHDILWVQEKSEPVVVIFVMEFEAEAQGNVCACRLTETSSLNVS